MWRAARLTDSYRGGQTEDRAEVVLTSQDALTLIVADGVGGQEFGGPAAERALVAAREGVTAPEFRIADARAYHGLLTSIDGALSDAPECGQTTLVVVTVTPRRIVGASVGDSEAWWVTEGGHFDLTGAQEKKPYLGSGAAAATPFALPTPPTGTLLVATDGLFKYAHAEAISGTVAAGGDDLEGTGDRLAGLARSTGGRLWDDLALLLCRWVPGALSPAAGAGLAERVRRVFGRPPAPAEPSTTDQE